MTSGNGILGRLRTVMILAIPAIASLVCGALATGKVVWWPILAGVVAIAGVSYWKMTSDARADKEKKELAEELAAAHKELERAAVFDAGVQPVTEWLGKLFKEEQEREVIRKEILTSLMDTGGQMVCPEALCAFYELSSDHKELIRVAPSGDGSNLPRTYSEADDNGAYMVFLAKSRTGRPKYVPDIDDIHLEGGDRIRLTTGYKTALFLPVRAGSEPLGLLVIQTLNPGDIPAPKPGDMLDGNYRKFYGIANLLSISRIAHRTPIRINGQRTSPGPADEPTILPAPE